MQQLLKKARLEKRISTYKVSQITEINQALISKFENGKRIPTKKQIQLLASVLHIDLKELLVAWYKVKIKNQFELNTLSVQAIIELLEEKGFEISKNPKQQEIEAILTEIEHLKEKLTGLKS